MTSYKTAVLDNGLRIIVLPSASSVVYCGYQINAGTANEETDEEGIAHFCEHVSFKEQANEQHLMLLIVWNRLEVTSMPSPLRQILFIIQLY